MTDFIQLALVLGATLAVVLVLVLGGELAVRAWGVSLKVKKGRPRRAGSRRKTR